MISPEDVDRLVSAHENVTGALEKKAPRRGAKILCQEFKWLLEAKGTFWADVKSATETLNQYREKEREILSNIASLLEGEEQIFAELGIDPSRTGPILANAYGALKLAQVAEDDLTIDALDMLRERLGKATELICRESRGRFRRGVDWVFSWKGATVLSGAAVVGGNVAITAIPPHAHGALSLVSVKSGIKVMRGEVEDILDLFS